jgi:hypothetical protein
VQGGSALLVFSFPKSEAITLADKEVEFVSKLCSQSFGGFGGGGGGGAVPQNGPLFSMQGGGGGGRGGQAGGANATPACNLTIKKKFKLKDMAVKGEPAL